MKKFLLVLTGLLLFSTQTNAACYVGMVEAKYYADGTSRGVSAFVCTNCSGNTCTAYCKECYYASHCKKYNISAGKCSQCEDGWTMGHSDCRCDYDAGRYVDYTVTKIINGYGNLATGIPCSSCASDYKINGGSCKKCGTHNKGSAWACHDWTCNSGYYQTNRENGYCKPCFGVSVANGTCTTCTATNCTSVLCGFGGKCPSCSGVTCTSATCSAGYAWNGSGCARLNCAAGQYVNGNSCAACPSGQWSKGGTVTSCSPCSSLSVANGTCTACSAAGTCSEISCSDGYIFKAGACVVKKCMAGTYEDASGNCRPCSDIAVAGGECTSCSYDGSVCESVSCNEGWTNASVTSCTATKVCSAGGFWDEESQSCKRCDTYMIANGGCVECDAKACSKAECDKPNMTFDQNAQKCGVECAADTYLDASFACKACEKGQYAAGGWSAEPTNCTACSAIAVEGGTCVECENGECLKASCGDGWRLDESGKKCLKNAANCLDGLTVSADGCCCVK